MALLDCACLLLDLRSILKLLQYFGRDSMIALRLLMPTLAPEAIEAVLGAVLERANETGALCHEETIGSWLPPSEVPLLMLMFAGDYASFVSQFHVVVMPRSSHFIFHIQINVQNNQSYLGGQPFYDYKMIDTGLLHALPEHFGVLKSADLLL